MRVTLPVLILLAACAAAPVEEEIVDEAEPVTAANGERLLKEAVCDHFVACETVGAKAECARLVIRGLDDTTFGTHRALFDSVRANKVKLDAKRARICLDEIRSSPCEATAVETLASTACDGAFTGTQPVGGACITSAACLPHAACRLSENPQDGACVASCVALEEGTCERAADCGAGEACSGGTCDAYVSPGASDEPCGTGNSCRVGLVCVAGMCGPPPRRGEACAPGKPCAEASLTCVRDVNGSTCRTALEVNKPCRRTDECRHPLVCDQQTGACKALPSSGACLRDLDGWKCDTRDAYCDEVVSHPTCQSLRLAGAACDTSAQCAYGPLAVAGWAKASARRLDCRDDGDGRKCALPHDTIVCDP